jgi:bifunctional non-homologous end joining protein LigD
MLSLVVLSNADRVVYPEDGITKGEVFDYYGRVGERMLPYIAHRALTVERYPKGLGGAGFMQKNAPDFYPDDLIGRCEVARGGGGTTTYPVVRSTGGIAYFANLSAITFHAPPATVDDMLHPDWVIWDLDPPEGQTNQVRAAAHALRSILIGFDIPTFVMTSGSKGYHLRAPLDRTADFAKVADLARGTAALAAAVHPDLMTLAFKKAERGHRVFVDWLRNAPLSTAVVPWSLRARTGAPIAVPLEWDEVDSIAPDAIGLDSIAERLETDRWTGLVPIDLTEAATLVSAALDETGIQLEPFDRFRS